MPETEAQTRANHARLVPGYHYVTAGLIFLFLVWSIWRVIGSVGFESVFGLVLAFALIGVFLYSRTFALRAQDRLIRLEERLRMQEILPEDLRPRIGELSVSQMVALRFASDGELADRVREVLDEGLTSRADIKKRIQHWRPDHDRV